MNNFPHQNVPNLKASKIIILKILQRGGIQPLPPSPCMPEGQPYVNHVQVSRVFVLHSNGNGMAFYFLFSYI